MSSITRREFVIAIRHRPRAGLWMATVYLANDLKHHRQVAVKVPRPELAAVIGAERFLTENRTTARLQHRQTLPLYATKSASRAGSHEGES